jgi:O-antigen ligase
MGPLLAGGAALFGAMIAVRPAFAFGLFGLALIVLLAFAAPVAHLMLLVFLTAIVPYGLQNQYGFGGGEQSAGLLASDVVLMVGLVRAVWATITRPLGRLQLLASTMTLLFLGGLLVQMLRALLQFGYDPSEIGAESRVLLGFGTVLIAIPLLREQATRERLFKAFAGFALVLGCWGLIQWTVDIPFAAAGDVGVREGVHFTTEGRGQVQGGLYAFAPMSVILFSVLVAGAVRGLVGRVVVITALILNLVSLVLTYERTFWVATVLACGLVIIRTGGTRRTKALIAAPVALVVFLGIMTTVAPSTLGAARERLLSIGQYGSDNSLRYRIVESRHVIDQIEEAPILGWGPGAEILWGRPWEFVKPSSTPYAHNGYLWLAWKLGIPIALLLIALLLAAILRRPPRGNSIDAAVARGCQLALVALLLATATFPSFSALSITASMGVMIAVAIAMPRRPPAEFTPSGTPP